MSLCPSSVAASPLCHAGYPWLCSRRSSDIAVLQSGQVVVDLKLETCDPVLPASWSNWSVTKLASPLDPSSEEGEWTPDSIKNES